MKKKFLIPVILICVLLVGGIVYLALNLRQQQQENAEMVQLAELDKKEMENQYQRFADQYSEMRTQINNDSLVAQLTMEQEKTQRLLNELRNVKSTDAKEIARLKRELETVRAVLRSYIIEIDSLNRLNQDLTAENTQIKGQYEEATRQIEGLNTEKSSLSEKVAIASQLDATGINMTLLNKRGKAISNTKKATTVKVDFSIAKNVTAKNGMRTFYIRVLSPTGSVLGNAGPFPFENKSLTASMKKAVEYGGQQTSVTVYLNVDQALVAGSYNVSIFVDGNMIGSNNFSFK